MVVFVCTSLGDILLPVCSAKLNLVKVAICSKAMKSAALEYQEVLFIDQDFFISEATLVYCLEDITVLEQNTDPISQHDFAYTFL